MSYPNGWLIRMKQYLRRSGDSFDKYEELFHTSKGNSALYTAFGNFDRIEFMPIERFSDYRSRSAEDHTWYGKRQSIILYGLSGDGDRLFQAKESDKNSSLDGATNLSDDILYLMEKGSDGKLRPIKSRFFIHTMMHISGTAKSSVHEYTTFLSLIKHKIQEVVKVYRETKSNHKELLNCEVFGTFNSAEIAVLWAADQFTDVLFLLDQLRHMRFEISGEDSTNTSFQVFEQKEVNRP